MEPHFSEHIRFYNSYDKKKIVLEKFVHYKQNGVDSKYIGFFIELLHNFKFYIRLFYTVETKLKAILKNAGVFSQNVYNIFSNFI